MRRLRTIGRWRLAGSAALVLLVLAVGAGVYVYRHSEHSTPVSEQRALQRFRAAQGSRPGPLSPRPGVYTYAVDGWECAGIGPLCLHRTLPARAYLIVTQRPSTLQFELDLSAQHRESVRYRMRSGARYETWEDTYLSFAGVAQDDAAATVPATVSLPAKLATGLRWTQVFHAGGLPVRSANRVLRRERIAIAGRNVSAWVIQSDSVTGGVHSGTEHDLTWHSQALGLDLREIVARRIGGVFPYRLQLSATLEGFTPAT